MKDMRKSYYQAGEFVSGLFAFMPLMFLSSIFLPLHPVNLVNPV